MSAPRPSAEAFIRNFAPGFNDTAEEDSLPLGAMPDAKNCMLTRVGRGKGARALLSKRNGCRLLNASVIASGKRVDITEFTRSDADSEFVAVCNGTVYAWDGAAWNAVSGGTGFTADAPVRFGLSKNNLLITDGTLMLRYNGTACFPIGNAGSATAPTLAVGAATGVTGTYEGYWVGYDPVMEHETSPSPVSSAVVFTDDKRDWTRPAHTLPANYTKWRVYVRRTDTSENNFFRAGEQDIGTATLTETTSDTARRDLGVGPLSSVNDPPPVLAWVGFWKGYAIGAEPDSESFVVSKQNDFESWHPRDAFRAGRNEALRSGKPFADLAFILQTDTRSFRLVGDKVPFQFVEVKDSLGNVCFDAAVEGKNWFYAWDKEKGPYRTNLEVFDPIADGRIETLVASVNRAYLGDIRCVRDAKRDLIIWSFPTSVDRKRTLIAWHERLECWLPPITGFEFYSLSSFTDDTGATGVYFGDYWGRVYELFSGDVDGVPSGTTSASITAATSSSITASGATFYTTGNGLAGMPAVVIAPSGAQQWVRISSNTGTVLTLDTTNGPSLSPVPASSGWTVVVGAIQWYAWISRLDFGRPDLMKRGQRLYLQGGSQSAAHALTVRARFNGTNSTGKSWSLGLPATGGVWGSSTWGGSVWGASGTRRSLMRRIPRAFHTIQIGVENVYPSQPFVLASLKVTGDALRRRLVFRG